MPRRRKGSPKTSLNNMKTDGNELSLADEFASTLSGYTLLPASQPIAPRFKMHVECSVPVSAVLHISSLRDISQLVFTAYLLTRKGTVSASIGPPSPLSVGL